MKPTLEREWALISSGRQVVVAMDEVGRGAIAGPVTVAAGLWGPNLAGIPEGIRDSKLVPEKKRVELADRARDWLRAVAVGHASPQEIDRQGITVALGLAGARALEKLGEALRAFSDSVILLDGHHDWLSAHLTTPLPVLCQVKGDRDCASISAVSLVAKVERDQVMIDAHQTHPVYGFDRHKGYGSADHFAAIETHGPSEFHRLTWLRPTKLPFDED